MPVLPRGLHSHTTLETPDIAKALRFYREVLGLSTAQQPFNVGLLCATNGHIAAPEHGSNTVKRPDRIAS